MERQEDLYKALKEVSIVLEYTNPILREKVPKKFIWFMNNFKDDTHYFRIDVNKPLEEQKLMYDSILILSTILKRNWCDSRTFARLRKEYSITKKQFLMDSRMKKNQIDEEINALCVIKEEGFFKKLFRGIANFFGIHKNRLYTF